MPYQVFWLVEGRVIFAELTGDLSLEEYRSYDTTICEHLNAATAPQAHYLVNTSQLESVPSLNDTREFTFLTHPRMGWTAAVGVGDPLVRLIGNFMSKLYKVRSRELKTVDEALDFLQKVDATLPDLRAALKGINSQLSVIPVETHWRAAPIRERARTGRPA